MLITQMARTNGAAASLPGGVGVREFAAREFPREDYHWVVAQVTRPSARAAVGPGVWARIRRWFGTPRKSETEPEAALEPAPG